MKVPQKVRVEQGGHTIEGDMEYHAGGAADGKASYSMTLTNGYFVCGPHDPEGNHVEEAS